MASVWLTAADAAAYAKVNAVTLRRGVKAGTLIAYRVNGGRNVRYRREDIDCWLTRAPVEEEAARG